MQRYALLAEVLLKLAHGGREVRVLAVHSVDQYETWQGRLIRVAPGQVGTDLDAGDRVDHDQRGVGGADPLFHFALEIGVSRCVDQVNLQAVKLAWEDR